MGKPLLTGVGSFPRIGETPEESIRRFADLQLELGFDLITDGEPRNDMIAYFLADIPGLGVSRGKPAILDKVREPGRPADSLKAQDLGLLTDHLKSVRAGKPMKIAVTGPVTLGFTCALGSSGPYGGLADPNLYLDLSSSLGSLAKYLQSKGAFVQIDEPGLSGGFIDPVMGAKYLRVMTSELDPDRTILHACGKISSLLHDQLLGIENVGTLSHAFASSPENLRVLNPSKLAEEGKRLAVGCARVDIDTPDQADSPAQINSVLSRVESSAGENLVACAHPDCGLRGTGVDSALAVLRNLSQAIRT